ncbi:hypothetical protein IEE94_13595 [Yimella sp. cx-573]|nr:hypothetical protein [Yimella sp. cx-573]
MTRGPLPREEIERAKAGLKPFQKQTVSAVVEALFERNQRRFLVADEVGLGKTKIARAVVAETVERLWHDNSVDRIDVVYICSNYQIARQNVRDLNIMNDHHKVVADRITMLPQALADIGERAVNVLAFSPQTSFNFSQARGRVGERAMLFKLLMHDDLLGSRVMSRTGAHSLFALGAQGFDWHLSWLHDFVAPAQIISEYRAVLEKKGLLEKVLEMSDGRRSFEWREQQRLIGKLRRALAEASLHMLTPDLIILDEFQRFTSILDGEGEDAAFARLLFDYPGARTLLLSATPYRMLSRAGDDDESAEEGFSRTVRFLLEDGQAHRADELRSAMLDMRRGVLSDRDVIKIAAARDRAQSVLRDVMVRTERLAATPNRDGMLSADTEATCPLTPPDVTAFVGTDGIVQELKNVPSIVEYWKSAPYLVNFMDEYKVKKQVAAAFKDDAPKFMTALKKAKLLDRSAIETFGRVDSCNPRTRWLIDDLDAAGAFDRLWVPPAHPQTKLTGAYANSGDFTKRLIFSGWAVAPKAVAGLVSYEYERRQHRADRDYRETTSASSRMALPRLDGASSERFTTLALLLPCRTLAELGDPLACAKEHGWSLPLSPVALESHVAKSVEAAVAPLVAQAGTAGPSLNIWYAGALAYLDPAILELNSGSFDAEKSGGLQDHLDLLREQFDDPGSWGPPPNDLIERLTQLAIAGPATCSVRSLQRLAKRFDWSDEADLLDASSKLAWAFRSFFAGPQTEALVSKEPVGAYWMKVLNHCIAGGLSSVMDEWMHLLPDQQRLNSATPQPFTKIAEAAANVLTLKDGRARSDFFDRKADDGKPDSMDLRTHFAMRFGHAKAGGDESENPQRVRDAFNSPFRPFVLISTSVGQEGLDFHHYAHAVVHWNLPGNPVDLEQREGRVHRYKNHAVRKNIARDHGRDPRALGDGDPWVSLFDAADDHGSGMRPWWVYPGKSTIQRLVPMLPMSLDEGRLRDLVKATTLYRMAMGQPRQAELLEVLAELDPVEQEAIRSAVTINLSPAT